ncbi:hypothetical protein TcG_12112 [Trypanosoma cruzi]|uniref:Uncharacterized protein n=1 Tax=Trypanosoma cruzi Dm28c TaxID=1416333 RepID=V5B0R5_TRYCR|nr:hypothetical protein TCDM_11317 [Trypanosoma cruzi Dm28c]RNE98974.1 hypothetical protein TcG_12112 [Trypanosoma cruzi]
MQRLVRPGTPRNTFWLGASTVRCTTATRQSHRVRPPRSKEGYFCPPGRQSSTAAEDCWFRAPTKLKRLTLLRCIEDVRSPIYSEPMPPSMHNQLAASIPLPRDAVINDYTAYVILLGYPTATIVLLLFNIVISSGTLCVAINWNLISHALPKTPLTTSSARLLTLFTPPQEILILNYGQNFLHLSPNSHLDTLHYCMAPPRQMIPLWRYIVQQLAGSHPHIEQSALRSKMFLDISYLLSGNIPIAHTNPGVYGLPVEN